MEVERKVEIAPKADDGSPGVTDRRSGHMTFIPSAAAMPRFSKDELEKGREQISEALKKLKKELNGGSGEDEDPTLVLESD